MLKMDLQGSLNQQWGVKTSTFCVQSQLDYKKKYCHFKWEGLVFLALFLALIDPIQFATPEENCN